MVQALLEGISLCQPQPKLPSELIKFLGKTFCAWHTAIPLLESHVFLFPEACPCALLGGVRGVQHALMHIRSASSADLLPVTQHSVAEAAPEALESMTRSRRWDVGC